MHHCYKLRKLIISHSPPKLSHIHNSFLSSSTTQEISISNHILTQKCLSILSYSNSKSLIQGTYTHSPFLKLGLIHSHLYLTNLLLSLYCKMQNMCYAYKLFDEMFERDIASWTTLISCHVKYKDYNKALEIFQEMILFDPGLVLNEFTFSTVLQCTSAVQNVSELGFQLHGQILKLGFGSNLIVSSALLDFCSKLRETSYAEKVFDAMPQRDTISYTIMISKLIESNNWEKAFEIYNTMIKSGIKPNEITFAKLLSSNGPNGKIIHTQLIRYGLNLNLILKTVLVNYYCKINNMKYALRVFNQTKEKDVQLYTSLINGFSQNKDVKKAIFMFKEMEKDKLNPNNFTYAGIISNSSLNLGKQIHSRIIKIGLECDLSIGNSLVDFYNKNSNEIKDPITAFELINFPNVISFTTLISVLINQGEFLDAIYMFDKMRLIGIKPNSYTISTILKGCNSIETLILAKKVHGFVIKSNLDCTDISVGNSLIHLYSRFNEINDAYDVFNSIPILRDANSYTSLVNGLNKARLYSNALETVHDMINEGIKLDFYSLSSFLSLSASSANLLPGFQFHNLSVKLGFENYISVSNSLIDMYGKCKCIKEAKKIFKYVKNPNVVTFNGFLTGLIQNGFIEEVFNIFEDMILYDIKPDQITFVLIMQACNKTGLVDKGIEYFTLMREKYKLDPLKEHYKCLLDMMGQTGRLEEAFHVLENMEFEIDLSICKILIGWCKVHGNLGFGEYLGRKGIELDKFDFGVYKLLMDLYYGLNRSDLGDQIRSLMREREREFCKISMK